MLRRLLELEVPEIYNGAVEIKSIAREAGARSKVAVAAKQAGVDPVGSCVGMKGVRIQSIVGELGGEKIDVIEWSPDTSLYLQKSLSPARVLAVYPDDDPVDGKTALVVVPDDQLSLAIGREGQNARLAAKLTGWRIDIKSTMEAATEAVRRAKETEMAARLPQALLDILPTGEAVVQRHTEQSLPWNTEELQLVRQLVDGVHRQLLANRDARRAAARAAAAALAPKPAAPSERAIDVQALLARIPPAAFETRVVDLGLSSRVFAHLEKAGLVTVGQILQRLAEGDEAMLSLEGIGPKGLAEVKAQIEAKGVGFAPEVKPEAPAPVEAVPIVEVAPVTEVAAVPVAEVAVPVAEAAVTPVGEVTSPVAQPITPVVEPIVVPLPIEALIEEEIEEEGGKLGKKGKEKARQLVFDERLGTVVAKKQRKPGRQRGLWEPEDE